MNRMPSPLVSVIVPSFNQGRYIRETLDSILGQDYRPLEVIVMDGASTDETVDVLRSYDVPELRWWSERDRGVVDAVNKGLREAKGEIVAIQSSDDVYLPGAVRTAVDAFAADRELALVFGDIEHIDSESRPGGRSSLPPFGLLPYLAKLTYIPQPAAFFRAAAAREVGGWREDISYAADAEFYLRLARRFPVRKIDAVISGYRHHPEQRDRAGEKITRDWERAVAPYLRDGDRAIRSYARAGIWNVRYHYTPEGRWLYRTWALYRFAFAAPAVLRDPEIRERKDWLPARYPLWRLLSRIKRLLT